MSDRPNPTSIAISTLIALYLDPSSPLEDVLSDDDSTKQDLLDHLQLLVRKAYVPLSDVIRPLQASISQIFFEILFDASESIDSLVDLMMSIQAMDVDGELGIYVRKMNLGFNKLSFESTTQLWEAFRQEVTTCADVNDKELQPTSSATLTEWSLSSKQKEDLIRLKCLALDENISELSPEELAPQVKSIMEQEQDIPASHFLKFLINLQKGSKEAALDALHQYFDYAMIAERKDVFNRQVILHYATLILAAAHQEFGDEELSKKATEEAIHVAQQSGDPACVAHALSLLYRTTGNRDILERCAVRAMQGKLRRLIAGANLMLAQTACNSNQAWESLIDATSDPQSLTIDRPTHIDDVSSPSEAMEILGETALFGAGIWDTMGFQCISAFTTEVGLACYGKYLTSATKNSAMQNLARKLLYGPLLLENQDNLCRYGLALEQVLDQGFAFGSCLLLHEWAVRRGEYGHAKCLIEHLYSQLHPRIENFKLSRLEVIAQHALLLARQGWVVKAKSKIEEAIEKCRKEGWVAKEANLLIQLCIMQLDTDADDFRSALKPIRECIKLTTERNMDSMHATATSIMAQIHFRMADLDTCISMLKGTLPTLHQNANVWFVGEAYLILAKSYLKREQGTTLSRSCCDLVLLHLDKSCDHFSQCQDFVRLKEVYYWQARIYDHVKDLNQRDEAAERFVDISRQLAKGALNTGLGEVNDLNYLRHLARRKIHR
mmetsp:Transcript_1426/g.1915  ORF Transcript_1426/g.1915 Transcript_1426/m.1915 type:complete len:722 (+) Transcript_1426:77-2242(+)